jgi:hypothetical protein
LFQLKRQHSAEPLNANNNRRSPASIGTTSHGATPPAEVETTTISNQTLASSVFGGLPEAAVVGSPLKKHRPSVYDIDSETLQTRLGVGFTGGIGDVLNTAEGANSAQSESALKVDEDEDL